MRLLILLPFGVQTRIGKFIGRLAVWLAPKKRHIAQTNLKLCFPDKTDAERRQILVDSFESAGIGLFESTMAWWASDKRIQPLLHSISGVEHIHQAQAQGKGVLLFIAHFTSLHMAGRFLSKHCEFTAMSRNNKNKLLDAIMISGMSAHCDQAFVRGGVKQLLRQLKQRKVIWYAPDLNVRRHQAVFVPFFGIPAATVSVTSRLAQNTDAAVIPFFFHRRDDGKGYDLTIYPPLENYPTDDVVADTTTISQIQEAAIKQQPGQYLWAYKRFKTRPEGEPSIYENA